MEILERLLVLLHLVGFAALFGGLLVQLRSRAPEINTAMLHGSLTQLVTGLALMTLQELGPDPVNHAKLGIKLVVTIVVVVLVLVNRRKQSVSKGLWGLLLGLTLLNAALAVLWVPVGA